MSSGRAESLLINGVWSNAVGHVMESVALANALRRGDSELRIVLLLNAASPIDIFRCLKELRLEVVLIHTLAFDETGGICLNFDNLATDWDYLYLMRDER